MKNIAAWSKMNRSLGQVSTVCRRGEIARTIPLLPRVLLVPLTIQKVLEQNGRLHKNTQVPPPSPVPQIDLCPMECFHGASTERVRGKLGTRGGRTLSD